MLENFLYSGFQGTRELLLLSSSHAPDDTERAAEGVAQSRVWWGSGWGGMHNNEAGAATEAAHRVGGRQRTSVVSRLEGVWRD